MFDIAWGELIVIGVVALIVIGPKELPAVLRAVGQWTTKIRRMATEFQSQFQEALREAEMSDLKKEVDNLNDTAKGFTSQFNDPLNLKEATKWEPKTDETKTDETKVDEAKTDEPKTDETKTDEPRLEAPAVETAEQSQPAELAEQSQKAEPIQSVAPPPESHSAPHEPATADVAAEPAHPGENAPSPVPERSA
jgi:sec-independent protein translocase protein TatB